MPKVLAVWTTLDENARVNYCLMMEFIEGIPLDSEWLAKLSTQDQNTICAKVSAQIRYLRSLPSEGYYGRVYGQGWVDPPPGLWVDTGTEKSVSGPYRTYEEFISALFRAYELQRAGFMFCKDFPAGFASRAAEFLSLFPGWNSHEPKFTWIDPKLTNIIVRQPTEEEPDWKVFLVDWESCGWYPAWLQALQCWQRGGAMIRDPSQPEIRPGLYPLVHYRREELAQQILKEFDPNPDWDRFAKIRKQQWMFF